MGEEREVPKPSRRWPRWVACVIGFITSWSTWLFISNTLSINARPEYVVLFQVFQEVRHPARYEVEFCGVELARDDNPDGHDIGFTVALLRWMDTWGTRLVSLVWGLLVGCVANIFLRLTFQPRRSEAG